MPELRLHYTTDRRADRTAGAGAARLGRLGGQHADAGVRAANCSAPASRWMPRNTTSSFRTAIGHGKSSKPSDGMKTAFPKYNYEDMVDAQYRLLKEGLGVKHLRLVIGNSMGGMHTWIWGGKYPQFMDALVPMASQPTEMAARNWMLRRMMLETIRNDPDYNGGNYTAQPRMMKYAINAYGIATGGGTLAYQALAPTAAKADKMVDDRLATAITADANDFIYQWEASHDYNPAPALEKIEATLLADQCRRRRAQSAGNRRHRRGAEARQERPPVPDPGLQRDARPSHHRQCEVLQQAAGRAAADRAAAGDVSRHEH